MEKIEAPLVLGTEKIRKLLMQFALPAIIAMTASSIYNIVDSIFIGHGVGALAISGLAITFPLMNLAAAFGSLVGVGASTLVSVKLGERDYEGANHGKVLTMVTVVMMLLLPHTLKAQQSISLNKAVQMAIDTYPSIEAARLDVRAQKEMKRSAWDIGATEIATGTEEKGKNNDAITTLISVRQNLDILGIGARSKFYGKQVDVSRAQVKVEEREIRREVSIDYGMAYVAHQRRLVYDQLDSIYRDFEKAAKLRYETEATSKLEYISAQNQARQINLTMLQVIRDEQIALINLNRWLGDKTSYTTDSSVTELPTDVVPSSTIHPIMFIMMLPG